MYFQILALVLIVHESILLTSQHTPKITPPPSPSQNAPVGVADVEQDEGPKAELDLCIGPKDAYVVEVNKKIKMLLLFTLGSVNSTSASGAEH